MPLLPPSKPVRTTGHNLVGLWRPSFVRVGDRLYLYGGGGTATTELRVLHLRDLRWDTVQPVKGTPPSTRYGHTTTLWNNFIIVFGGCNESQEYCDDVHLFDLEKHVWSKPNIKGSVIARYLHSATVYDDKLFVYGGFARDISCTYVLNELCVLDLQTFTWTEYDGVPPRYNHSATLVGHKMYIYAGKDEHGNTVSDLFMINLSHPPYTPHLILNGSQWEANAHMVLLKSQHFCEAVCGKLIVFGRYLANGTTSATTTTTVTAAASQSHTRVHRHRSHLQDDTSDSDQGASGHRRSSLAGNVELAQPPQWQYGLWMLDLDTLDWQQLECSANFGTGGWNYFTVIPDSARAQDEQSLTAANHLFFLGNTDPFRANNYNHFRDALIFNGEALGLYDIQAQPYPGEFTQLLDNPELSDFVIVAAGGKELHVHRVILITRWPHFRNMHHSGMLEIQQGRMDIPESYEVVLVLMRYLYSDCLEENVPWDVICEVLVIADLYLLSRLKKMCCERLSRRHLRVETCVTVLEKAIMADEDGLKLIVLDFMFRNFGLVLKSNVLSTMPTSVQQEFLAAVSDEAVLEVTQPRLTHSASSFSTTAKPAMTRAPHLSHSLASTQPPYPPPALGSAYSSSSSSSTSSSSTFNASFPQMTSHRDQNALQHQQHLIRHQRSLQLHGQQRERQDQPMMVDHPSLESQSHEGSPSQESSSGHGSDAEQGRIRYSSVQTGDYVPSSTSPPGMTTPSNNTNNNNNMSVGV